MCVATVSYFARAWLSDLVESPGRGKWVQQPEGRGGETHIYQLHKPQAGETGCNSLQVVIGKRHIFQLPKPQAGGRIQQFAGRDMWRNTTFSNCPSHRQWETDTAVLRWRNAHILTAQTTGRGEQIRQSRNGEMPNLPITQTTGRGERIQQSEGINISVAAQVRSLSIISTSITIHSSIRCFSKWASR